MTVYASLLFQNWCLSSIEVCTEHFVLNSDVDID